VLLRRGVAEEQRSREAEEQRESKVCLDLEVKRPILKRRPPAAFGEAVDPKDDSS
jgi:hypothetical protein